MPGPASTDLKSRTTVLVSVLCAALVTAVIITVGVIALQRSGGDGDPTVPVGSDGQSAESQAPAMSSSATSTSSAAPSATPSRSASGSASAPAPDASTGAATGGASAGEPAEGRGSTGDTADAGTTDGTDSVPTPGTDELTDIVHLLTASDASDAEKEKYLESTDALIVPQTVSRVGLFRAPRGGSEITGPVERDGDTVTAHLNAWSQGIPDVSLPITFVYRDGTWRLSSASVCTGVRTVGLPVYCNA
jgi:hypothetical protein